MRVPSKLILALGFALAVPAAAYASQPSHHHYRPAHHGMVNRAAPAAPTVASGFWAPSATTPHQQYEVEGLTRDTDNCAKYGCLGAN